MPRKAAPKAAPPVEPLALEKVAIASLKPHPQNYREHTPDQLEHLQQSLQDYGVYKNIVVARDNTILAGHGLVEAAQQLGMTTIPVRRMDLDPQEEQAIRLLVGDNETARLALMQEQRLAGLLQGLAASPGGLLGTGYDADAVAALVQATVQGVVESITWDFTPTRDEFVITIRASLPLQAEVRARLADLPCTVEVSVLEQA